MKNYIYYMPNGKIVKSSNQPPNEVIQDSLMVIEVDGEPSISNMYVDNGVLKDLPSRPSFDYTFNYETFVWEDIRSDDEKIFAIKILRLKLLEQSDWTDTTSAKNRLGDDVYLKWQQYRQALRDIPTQSGYPSNVVWPTKPE
jgi:hypothetical protein